MTKTTERPIAPEKSTKLRELAFAELESSHATMRKVVGLMDVRNPLVRHMSQVLGVAENSLRILESNPASEIKQVTGPVHDETDEPREIDADVVDGKANANGNGESDVVIASGPAAHAVAHAQKLHYCGARRFGCGFQTHGNSYGRHQQLCEYFQTNKLLEAGYKIDTFEDFVKALTKENGGKIAASPESLKASIERRHGSYRKLLVEIKQTIKKHSR